MTGAKTWIDRLHLRPHPEGGYFRETYRSDELLAAAALPARFGGDRAFSTAIYFLLEGEDFSAAPPHQTRRGLALLRRLLVDDSRHRPGSQLLDDPARPGS